MYRRALLRLGGALAFSGAVATAELTKPSSCASRSLQLPSIGLGLWKAQPGEVHAAIKEAVQSGYRLLDGAAAYGNEPEVGRAIAECIREGLVSRDELWYGPGLQTWDLSTCAVPLSVMIPSWFDPRCVQGGQQIIQHPSLLAWGLQPARQGAGEDPEGFGS